MATYLRAGAVVQSYLGFSWCRFGCGVANNTMGVADLSDGEWVWPEGLAHYVEAHHVRLPDEILALAQSRRTPTKHTQWSDGNVDRKWWCDWGTARGACIRFDTGWSPVGFQDASSIYKQLSDAGISEPTVLARRRDGDAILCSNFRVASLRTGKIVASASDAEEASFDQVAGAPKLTVPTEADLRAWSAEMIARPPRKLEVETVVVWVPDNLDGVVDQALAPGRFILLGTEQGVGGRWQRFYREQ